MSFSFRRGFLAFITSLALVFLVGCSTPHVIKLKDGREFVATGNPAYDEESGFYEFRTIDGKNIELNKDLIESIHSK